MTPDEETQPVDQVTLVIEEENAPDVGSVTFVGVEPHQNPLNDELGERDVVRDVVGRVWHAKSTQRETESSWFGECGTPVMKSRAKSCLGFVNCRGCRSKLLPKPARPVKVRTAPQKVRVRRPTPPAKNPPWKTHYDPVKSAKDNAKHAYKALVGALEWMDRGGDGQFFDQALDQLQLAYRFLEETMIKEGRVMPYEETLLDPED